MESTSTPLSGLVDEFESSPTSSFDDSISYYSTSLSPSSPISNSLEDINPEDHSTSSNLLLFENLVKVQDDVELSNNNIIGLGLNLNSMIQLNETNSHNNNCISPSLLSFTTNFSTQVQPLSNSALLSSFQSNSQPQFNSISQSNSHYYPTPFELNNYQSQSQLLKEKERESLVTAGLLFKPLIPSIDSYASTSKRSEEVLQLETMINERGRARSDSSGSNSSNSSQKNSSSILKVILNSSKEKSKGKNNGKGKGRGRKSRSPIVEKEKDIRVSSNSTSRTRGRKFSSSPIPSSPTLTLSSPSPQQISNHSSGSFNSPYTFTSIPFSQQLQLPSLPSPPSFSSILARLKAAESKSQPPPINHVAVTPLNEKFSQDWEAVKRNKMNEGWSPFIRERKLEEESLLDLV